VYVAIVQAVKFSRLIWGGQVLGVLITMGIQ
jgi:hypothetical protein